MLRLKNALLIALISLNLRLAINSIMANTAIIQADLDLSNFQGGLLTSVPLVCMGLFALFVNQVQKRLGRRLGIGVFTLWLGLGSLMRFGANNYLILLLSTVVVGSGIAIIGPLISGFIKSNFNESANQMVALYTTMMGTGAFISSAASPWLIETLGSWQRASGIWGFLAVISGLVWLVLTPRAQQETVTPAKEVTTSSPLSGAETPSLRKLWTHPLVWQLILLYGAQAASNYAYSTWIQPYAISQGLSVSFGSLLVSILVVFQTLSNLSLPLLINHFGSIKMWTLICGILMVIGSIMMFTTGEVAWVAITATALLGYGGSGIFNIGLIIPIRLSATPEEASVMTSVMQTVGYQVGALAPILVGQIVDLTGYSNALIVMTAIMGILTAILAFSRAVELAN